MTRTQNLQSCELWVERLTKKKKHKQKKGGGGGNFNKISKFFAQFTRNENRHVTCYG